MQLNLFVRDVQSDQIIPVKVVPASDADLKQTASGRRAGIHRLRGVFQTVLH